jgi:aldehyde dehydrogenase (NAD+)
MPNVAEIFQSLEYGPAPESSSEANAWLDSKKRKFDLFIDGRFVKAKSGSSFETINPATKQVLASISSANETDVDAAVKAARKAFLPWSKLSGHARARHLYALARLVQKHSRLFAVLETLDNGKSIRESRDIDIPLVARHFYHHAGWAQLLESEFPDHAPVGVVGQVIPWNFPLLMLAWKVAPALAAGNTVVLKPAEYTPLTALLFAQITLEAGLPPGVLNIVTGDGETGKAIVNHPDIDKIAFTGSTEVGKYIRQTTAGSGKKLSLELGGKSPFLVFEDADLDSVVEGVVDAIWFNQGEVCCAGSRILVQEGVEAKLEAKLRARLETLRVGDPLDKAMDVGALASLEQFEKVTRLVQEGVAILERLSNERLFLSAELVHERVPLEPDRTGRNFWSRRRDDGFPNSRGGCRARQQHRLWAGLERLDGQHQSGVGHRTENQSGHRLDQLHQSIRCRRWVRRLP